MSRSRVVSSLIVLALVGLASSAVLMALPEVTAGAVAELAGETPEAAPDVPGDAEPAGEPEGAPSDPPALDLEPPKPLLQCKTGWCSNDAQCEEWWGPGSTCIKGPGHTCGHCS